MRSRSNSWNNTLTKLGFKRKRRKNSGKNNFARRLHAEGLEERRMLATYTVDSLSDVTAADGFTTLREAVTAANGSGGADTINFNVTGTITLGSGQISITDDLTITGPGVSSLTIDGAGASRVLNVTHATNTLNVGISGLTITGGLLSGSNTGAGIYSSENLTLDHVNIVGNTASSGSGSGGGLYSTGGNISILSSTIDDNSALVGGGVAILMDSGTLVEIANSTFSNNTSLNSLATPTAGRGGGLFISGGNSTAAKIVNTTFSGNTAFSGGAVRTQTSPKIDFVNNTVTDNDAVGTGSDAGGLSSQSGTVFTVHNSILVGNTSVGNPTNADAVGAFDGSSSYNLVGETLVSEIETTDGNANATVSTIELASLGNYGGPTQTHALLVGSVAIDKGSDSAASGASLTADQRGNSRNYNIGSVTDGGGGSTDVGAYELIAPTNQLSQQLYVDENSANSTIVGQVIATDPDSGTVFQDWQITTLEETPFSINSSGQIVVNDNAELDYELNQTFLLEITVSDGTYTSAAGSVAIDVGDVIDQNGDPVVITVNSTDDAVDASSAGDGVVDANLSTPGRQITLRGAIQEANALGLTGRVTINLPAGTYELDLTGTEGSDDAATALNDIDVRSNIEIVGDGVGSTIIDTDDINEAAFGVMFDSSEPGQLLVMGVELLNEPIDTPLTPPTSLPTGADEFSPNAQGTVNPSGAPLIAEYNRTVGPNESLTISGYKLSANDNAAAGEVLGLDTRVLVYGKNSAGELAYLDATIQRITAEDTGGADAGSDYQVAMITLPADLPAWSTYMVWIGNDDGWSKPIVVNQTEVWWVGPNKVRSGEVTSIFGRNLAHNNLDSADTGGSSALNTRVYIEPAGGGSGTWVTPTAVNPYKVDFVVPSLSEGSYKVWVHNGHGGEYGWSQAGTLTIESSASALRPFTAGNTEIDITSQTQLDLLDGHSTPGFLAPLETGAGKAASNADRLQAIVDRFGLNVSGNETLYLPAGVYEIDTQIVWRDGVSLLGDGQSDAGPQTVIKAVSSDWTGQMISLNSLTVGHVGFKSLKLDASEVELMDGTTTRYVMSGIYGFEDLVLDDVQIDAGMNDPFNLKSASRIFLTGCNIIGSDSHFSIASQVFIDDSHFRFTNNANNPISIRGSHEISITKSTGQDHDSWDETANGGLGDWDWDSTAGWGTGRFIVVASLEGTPLNGTPKDYYLGENKTFDVTVNPQMNQGNEGEHILFEAASQNASRVVGQVTGVSGDDITFQAPTNNVDYAGARLVVVDGKGLGQHRDVLPGEITDYVSGGNTIYTYEPSVPWEVVPDTSSTIALVYVSTNVVTYKNDFDFKDYAKTATSIFNPTITTNPLTLEKSVKRVDYRKPISAIGIVVDDGSVNFIADSNRTQQSSYGLLLTGGTSGVVANAEAEFGMPAYWAHISQNEFGVDFDPNDGAVTAEMAKTHQGIAIWSGQDDGGVPTLGLTVRDNVVKAADVTRFVFTATEDGVLTIVDNEPVYVPGTPGDPTAPETGDITIDHAGQGLVVKPYDAITTYSEEHAHPGPTYIVFEKNDVTATKGFVNQVHSVNNYSPGSTTYSSANSGGRQYLANSYPEHLMFLGNTFDSGVANQAPEFDFNLRMDEDAIEAIVVPGTSDSTFHGVWTGNSVTPELPGDYQFHVLKDNVFKALGSAEDPDFFYGEVSGDPILSPYASRSLTLNANEIITLTLPILNPGSGAIVVDDVDDDTSEAWITFIGNLNDLLLTNQGAVTNLEFEISTVGLSAGSYSATIIAELDGLPDIEWTILLTVV